MATGQMKRGRRAAPKDGFSLFDIFDDDGKEKKRVNKRLQQRRRAQSQRSKKSTPQGDQAKDIKQQRQEQTMQREAALKRDREKKKTWKDVKSVAAAKKAGLKHYTGADGKKKLAITKEELGQKKGETLTEAYNRFEGKTPRKQSAASGTKSTTQKKKVGGLRKFLLGEDGKFGGARGAIDFLPGKSRPKRKAMGGMMKAKGMAKGGAAMKKKGYKKGGAAGKFPDLTGDGKVTQKDILRGRGVPGIKKGGAMTKKGYAKGGMTKKGYSKGGVARKGKPRGVGVALRGYGKALK